MTLKELSQLYYLNREIEMDKKRLIELDDEIKEIKETLSELEKQITYPSSPNYDGMPKSKNTENSIERNVEKLCELHTSLGNIMRLRADCAIIIRTKQALCIAERNKLENYIAGLPDSLLRIIFTYRFINGLPWCQVSANIGESTSEDSVKKMCYRYIKEINSSGK